MDLNNKNKSMYASLGKQSSSLSSEGDVVMSDVELQKSTDSSNSNDAEESTAKPNMPVNPPAPKMFCGYPRNVWVGTYIGGISVLCNHLIFSYIKFGDSAASLTILYFLPLLVVLVAIYLGNKGIKLTEPEEEEPVGSWDVKWFLLSGFVVYQSFLWGFDTMLLQLRNVLPSCEYNPTFPFNDDGTEAVWFPFNNYMSFWEQSCSWKQNETTFKVHALLGPLILLLGCFNFFKFSRNVVFNIFWHKWIGRVHNIMVIISGIAGAVLSTVTATPMWIEAGFVILGLLWVPCCCIGWYFIYVERNIPQHKRWMTRYFACTCTAISLRLYKLLGGDATPYWVCVWASLFQLPIVEYYLQETDDCDRIWLRGMFNRLTGGTGHSVQMPDGTMHIELGAQRKHGEFSSVPPSSSQQHAGNHNEDNNQEEVDNPLRLVRVTDSLDSNQ